MTQTIQRRVSTPPADSPLPRANSNLNQHLAYRFVQETGKRTMVVGHRGGFLGPENSLKGFQAAIDAGLEAELEYNLFWISGDFVWRSNNTDNSMSETYSVQVG